MKIQVKDIMSSPVVTAESGVNIAFIRELMERKGVSAIPIVEVEGEDIDVKGIVTVTDLRGVADENAPAEEIMTKNIQVIPKRTSAQAAAAAMLRNEVHHLLVVDRGRVVGMISSLDFTKMVAETKIGAFTRVMFW